MDAMTDREYSALEKKMNNPNKEIVCPRCGGKILHQEWPNGSITWCEREGCIKEVIRGF